MKKGIAVLLTVLLFAGLLAGCGASDTQTPAAEQKGGFNPELLEVLGKTYSEIKEKYGPADGAIWILGTAFHFPETDKYFCFMNEDDLNAKEPAEDAVCHAINATLSDFVDGIEPEKEYSAEDLETLTGLEVQEYGLSDMDSVYVYSITFEGHEVVFDTLTENVLEANTFAYVIERSE